MKANTRRILAAQAAVRMHQVVHEREPDTNTEDLIDLLTDLRHWARERGVNIGNCFSASLDNFKAERDE